MIHRKTAEARILEVLEEKQANLSVRYFYPLIKIREVVPGAASYYKRLAERGAVYYAWGFRPGAKDLQPVVFLSLNDLDLPPQTDGQLCIVGRDGHILSELAGRKLEELIQKHKKQSQTKALNDD